MRPIQILFVDGPTASGKDYLIDKFSHLYTRRFPSAKITNVRAVDMALQGSAKSEDRKYTTYSTPMGVVMDIYKGHIKLLDHLKVHSDLLGEHDLIIVNRSFLSYFIYNWNVLHDTLVLEGSKTTLETLDRHSLDSYRVEYVKRLQGISTMFVNLALPHKTMEDKVKLLVERTASRRDGMPVQTDWFTYLVKNYDSPPPEFLTLFDAEMKIESKDYGMLLDFYFN